MGMDIALEEAPRRGKDGIELHRGLLHSGGRDIRPRNIHGLSCRNKTRDLLIGKEVSRRPFTIRPVYETAQAKARVIMT
jgi:hypothetical protein